MSKRSRDGSGIVTELDRYYNGNDFNTLDIRRMHPRSRHNNKEDFLTLSKRFPILKKHMTLNLKWRPNMPNHRMYHFDFTHPDAVYHLSKAILKNTYNLRFYLPCGCDGRECDPESTIDSLEVTNGSRYPVFERYLAPCVPSRVNYIHHIADLLKLANNNPDLNRTSYENEHSFDSVLKGGHIVVLDIGTGANCIYPLLGSTEYDWNFIGVDIDEDSLKLAKKNISINNLNDKIQLRMQMNPSSMFNGVLYSHEFVFLTMSNPPFHHSIDETNLNPRTTATGKSNELLFVRPGLSTHRLYATYMDELLETNIKGDVEYTFPSDESKHGELSFIEIMFLESKFYASNVLWFTTLVAKLSTHKKIKSIIQSEMRKYLDSHDKQVSYLDTRIEHLKISSNAVKLESCDTEPIDVSEIHPCEIRTFTLNQGKQSRYEIVEKLQNFQ